MSLAILIKFEFGSFLIHCIKLFGLLVNIYKISRFEVCLLIYDIFICIFFFYLLISFFRRKIYCGNF